MKNNNNKIITMKDIDIKYTEILNKLLSKGLTIHSLSMSGGQGERSKVSLTNEKNVYVLLMKTEFEESEKYSLLDKMVILLLKYENSINKNTLWINDGEVIDKVEYYTLGKDIYDSSVFGSREECLKVKEKIYNRIKCREKSKNSLKINDKLLNIVKKHKGYGRTKLENVKEVARDKSRYEISFNNGKKSIYINFPRK